MLVAPKTIRPRSQVSCNFRLSGIRNINYRPSPRSNEMLVQIQLQDRPQTWLQRTPTQNSLPSPWYLRRKDGCVGMVLSAVLMALPQTTEQQVESWESRKVPSLYSSTHPPARHLPPTPPPIFPLTHHLPIHPSTHPAILIELNDKTIELYATELERPVFTNEETKVQKRKGVCFRPHRASGVNLGQN